MRNKILLFVLLSLAISFALIGKASCSNKDIVPFLGKWAGGFKVERVDNGPDTAKDRERSSLNGYVQIYGTNHSFKMHLEGEQQIVDMAGNWTLKKNRVTLRVTDFKMDDQGGEDARNPNMKFIPADVLQVGYSRPLVLELTADKKHLNGLLTSIGPLVGKHEFSKDSF